MIFKKPINWLANTRIGQLMLTSFYRADLDNAYEQIKRQLENKEGLDDIKDTINTWKGKYTMLAFPFRDVFDIANQKALPTETIIYLQKEGAKPVLTKSNRIVDALNWLATTSPGKFILKYFFNTDIDGESKRLNDYLRECKYQKADKVKILEILQDWKKRHSVLKFPFGIALHQATFTENPFEIIKCLLSEGADPNAKDKSRNDTTPFHWHSYLLDESTNTNQRFATKDEYNFIEDWKKVTRLLLSFGATLNATSRTNDTSLHFAVQSNCPIEIIKYLVCECKLDVNVHNMQRLTALAEEFRKAKINNEVVKLFIEYGYILNKQQTAFSADEAQMRKLQKLRPTEIVYLLCNTAIKIEDLHDILALLIKHMKIEQREDLIYLAVTQLSSLETIRFLVGQGISINPNLPSLVRSPLDEVAHYIVHPGFVNYRLQNIKIFKYLLEQGANYKQFLHNPSYRGLKIATERQVLLNDSRSSKDTFTPGYEEVKSSTNGDSIGADPNASAENYGNTKLGFDVR